MSTMTAYDNRLTDGERYEIVSEQLRDLMSQLGSMHRDMIRMETRLCKLMVHQGGEHLLRPTPPYPVAA